MAIVTRLRQYNWYTQDLHTRLSDRHDSYRNSNLRPSLCADLRLLVDKKFHSDIDRAIDDEQQIHRNPLHSQYLEDIYYGRALLWVGAGFSLDNSPNRRPGLTGRTIKELLARELTSPSKPKSLTQMLELPLGSVAELYERRYQRDGLVTELARICRGHLPTEPTSQHRRLARLRSFRFIVTTNWDRLIEAAFKETWNSNEQSLSVIRTSDDVINTDFSRPTLLKIHGDYDPEEQRFSFPPRITDSDFRALERHEPALFDMLKSLFASHRIIVIGFDLSDYNFLRLFDYLNGSIRNNPRPICFVDPKIDQFRPIDTGANHIAVTADDFLCYAQTFSDYIGGSAGFACRQRNKFPGSVSSWAEQQCEIAREVLELFPTLQRVDVVDSSHIRGTGRMLPESAKVAVGHRAAMLLKEFVRPGDSVALSCGSTLQILAELTEPCWDMFRRVRLFGTSVSALDNCNAITPYGLITFLANRLASQEVEAVAYQLPGDCCRLLASADFDEFLGQTSFTPALSEQIDRYLGEASKARIFVLGVGCLKPSLGGLGDYIRGCLRACSKSPRNPKEAFPDRYRRYVDSLRRLGYIGDVMYRFFKMGRAGNTEVIKFMTDTDVLHCLASDVDVSPLFKEFLSRLLWHVRSISPEVLRDAAMDESRMVALVASGPEKGRPVYALCAGGLANTLVVDKELATELLVVHKQFKETCDDGVVMNDI